MSDELWAAIIGAIVGFIGSGAISFVLQKSTQREARTQLERATLLSKQSLARALIFKIAKIDSNLIVLKKFIETGIKDAEEKDWNYWQAIRPLANLPDRIEFSSDEMSVLLSLKENDIFNSVISLDQIYNSTLEIFVTFRTSRNELAALLPAEKMNGIEGTTKITGEILSKAGPKMAEVNELISHLRERLAIDVAEVTAALSAVTKVFNEKLELGLSISAKGKRNNLDVSRP